ATVSVLERVRTKPSRLARQPLLRQLSPRQLRRMASVTEEVVVPAGELLVEQGRHGFWFFLVERGHADIVRDGRVVGSLGRGDHIGTTAVLWRVPEPVTVRARSEMTLFAVGNQWFVPLVRDLPALRRALGVPPAPPAVRAHRRRRPRAAVHEVAWLTGPVGPPRLSRLARWRVAAAVVVGLAAAALYHPPVAVLAPGPTSDAA